MNLFAKISSSFLVLMIGTIPVKGQFYSQTECLCLNNQTNKTDGQFNDLIKVHSSPNETWSVISSTGLFSDASLPPPALPTPIVPGTILQPISSKVYQLMGKRLNNTDWSLTLSNGTIVRTLSNLHTCEYLEVQIVGFLEACVEQVIDLNYDASNDFAVSQTWTISNGNIIGNRNNEQISLQLPSEKDDLVSVSLAVLAESNEIGAGTPCRVTSSMDVTLNDGPECLQALPVLYEHLSIKNLHNKAVIEWAVSQEINNKGWEIQQLSSTSQWNVVDFISSNESSKSYTFKDEKELEGGLNVYRLKQLDYDGNFIYTEALKIYGNEISDVHMYPNPSNGTFSIQAQGISKVEVYDLGGRKVQHSYSGGMFSINQDPGIYMVKIEYQDKIVNRKLIITD